MRSIKITDDRVSLMNEILNAVKLVKMYAWEDSFVQKVEHLRSAEMKQVRKMAMIRALNFTTVFSSTVTVSLVTVSFYFCKSFFVTN